MGQPTVQLCATSLGWLGNLISRSLLGFDHKQLTYRFSGRDFRLTDVHGQVVKEILT